MTSVRNPEESFMQYVSSFQFSLCSRATYRSWNFHGFVRTLLAFLFLICLLERFVFCLFFYYLHTGKYLPIVPEIARNQCFIYKNVLCMYTAFQIWHVISVRLIYIILCAGLWKRRFFCFPVKYCHLFYTQKTFNFLTGKIIKHAFMYRLILIKVNFKNYDVSSQV